MCGVTEAGMTGWAIAAGSPMSSPESSDTKALQTRYGRLIVHHAAGNGPRGSGYGGVIVA